MTIKTFRAALTAGLMLATASGALMTAQAAAAKGPSVSKDVAKALTSVQDTNKKGDFAASLASVQAAQALPNLTPYDQLMINRFMMTVQVNLKDMAAADVAAEAAGDTDPAAIPDDAKAEVYKAALQLSLNAKHYDKSMKYAKLYLALTPPPSAADQQLAVQALYLGGDFATSSSMAQKAIDASVAAGTPPGRTYLDILMASQVKQKDEVGAEKTLETTVSYYNQPEDWSQIIGVSYGIKGIRDIDVVYLGRLMMLVVPKPTPNDASLFGGTASHLAFYGDALAAQKVGGGGFPAPGPKADVDLKTISAQIAAGPKQNGEYNVKLAEALYGYGKYAEAETAARLAQSKGGVKDAAEPDMVIAMSQTAEGKYADAITTFGKVTSGSPATPRIVRLWTSYAKFKAAPPAAAAAAQ